MFIQLPSGLHEDELLYSALARSGDVLPPRALRDLLEAAFGGNTMTATIDLPSHLDAVGSRLLCMLGHDAPGRTLLTNHTLFPYYAFSAKPEVIRRAAALMRGDGGSIVHGLLGVRASRVPTPSRLRYCPRCVELDRQARGCAWWHRTHQLPGVLVCPAHAVPLLNSNHLTSGARNRLAFHSLEHSMTADDRPCSPTILGERDMACALAIADRSMQLLAEPPTDGIGVGIDALWCARKAALQMCGFRSGSHRIAVSRFRATLIDTLGTNILKLVGCLPNYASADDWVVRMARPPRRSAHPLYHVLVDILLGWLSGEGSKLISAASPSASDDNQHFAASPAIVVIENSAAVSKARDARLISLIGDSDLSLRAIARELGIDPLTVQRHAHRLGVWRDSWSHRDRIAPASKAVRNQAKALGDARSRWLTFGAIRPALGRTAMRARDPAAFALLYRRDRKWLERNSPPPIPAQTVRSGVDWVARDAQVAAELEAAATELFVSSQSRRAIRPFTIARAANRLALVQHHAARMPISAGILVRRSQEPKVLARARLEQTVAEWPPYKLSPPAASVLAKAAGLNPKRAAQLQSEIATALARLKVGPH